MRKFSFLRVFWFFFNLVVIIIIIIIPREFFTSASAGGLSLEFEWQQVSPSLQDSSQYSSRSQKCCGWSPFVLLFPGLLVPLPILQWQYQEHQLQLVSASSFLHFPSDAEVLVLLFTCFQFCLLVNRDRKVHNSACSLFFFFFFDYKNIWSRWGGPLKSQRSLFVSFSRRESRLYIYHLFVRSNLNSSHSFRASRV